MLRWRVVNYPFFLAALLEAAVTECMCACVVVTSGRSTGPLDGRVAGSRRSDLF